MNRHGGRPTAILTDIEGTTTPIAFVREVLFPYARAHLAGFIDRQAQDPAVAQAIAEAARLADSRPVLDALLGWMAEDAKVTPLKTLQGLIWDEGYRRGDLRGVLYPDVPMALRRWHADGLRLYVYSSGSTAAQKLLFGHTEAGDLASLFDGFFDTRVGAKAEPASYAVIASTIHLPGRDILFLSDMAAELDAAEAAGLAVCQLVRPQDGTIPSGRHPAAPDFTTIAAHWNGVVT